MIRLNITLIAILTISLGQSLKCQIIYDNGPIKPTQNPPSNAFQIQGNRWNKSCITYMFLNGTADIANNDERGGVVQAFQLWQAQTGLIFAEVFTETNADIRIQWATFSHGDPCACNDPCTNCPFDGLGNVLAHTFFPPPNFDDFAGDVHFDDSEIWTLNSRSGGAEPIDLITVAAHEIGHALGLDHSAVSGALMNPIYTGSHRYLAQDDIAAIRSIYGDPLSVVTNNNPVCNYSAFSVPNLPSGTTVTWSSGNSNALTISPDPLDPNTGAATRVGTSTGSVTITATINGCGNSPVSLTKTVWLGVPMFTNVSNNGSPVDFSGTIANPYIVNANNIVEVDALGSNGQINFTLGGSPYFVNGHADNSYIYEFICKYPNNNINLTFSAANGCGTNYGTIYFCNSNCTGGVQISSSINQGLSVTAFPNPVSNMLIVQLSDSWLTALHLISLTSCYCSIGSHKPYTPFNRTIRTYKFRLVTCPQMFITLM